MDGDAVDKQQPPDEMVAIDLEVILSLLQGMVTPAITVLSVMSSLATLGQAVSQQTPGENDWRATRALVFRMEEDMREAENLLRRANDFLLEHNYAHVQVWPAGINGMRLTAEEYQQYMRIVERTCVLIQRVDHNGMQLSNAGHVLRNSGLLGEQTVSDWQKDLHHAMMLQEKVIKAHTFGEKLRLLKLTIKMSRDVLGRFHRVLVERDAPAAPPERRLE